MSEVEFFVVFKNSDNERSYRRILTDRQMKEDLSSQFLQMQDSFFEKRDPIDYTTTYNLEKKNEYFRKQPFKYPDSEILFDGITRTDAFYPNPESEVKIRAFIAADISNKTVMFQSYHSLKFLTNNRSFICNKETFSAFKGFAFTVAPRLCAVFKKDELCFESVDSIKSFLDVKDLFAEASNEEIQNTISRIGWLECDDQETMLAGLDSIERKLFSQIGNLNIPNNDDIIEKIKEQANFLEIPLSFRDGKIMIPICDKKERKRTLNFLADNYYIGSLSGEIYRSNSKIKIEKN